MKSRRVFIGAVGLSIVYAKSSTTTRLPESIYNVISKVQGHLFPKGSLLPSAKLFGATQFLESTIYHSSYDRDIREFVLKGAKELMEREHNLFLEYQPYQVERALRAFEKTSIGGGWLNRVMILSIEALLSDPIYGGNFKELGWRALGTMGGEPRPTSRYIEL
jgi:hypothetical protein